MLLEGVVVKREGFTTPATKSTQLCSGQSGVVSLVGFFSVGGRQMGKTLQGMEGSTRFSQGMLGRIVERALEIKFDPHYGCFGRCKLYVELKRDSSSSSVFCPRAGPSLQTQAPRLQFCPKPGLPLQAQEPRLQFY